MSIRYSIRTVSFDFGKANPGTGSRTIDGFARGLPQAQVDIEYRTNIQVMKDRGWQVIAGPSTADAEVLYDERIGAYMNGTVEICLAKVMDRGMSIWDEYKAIDAEVQARLGQAQKENENEQEDD